jgi:hypothetical protein
MNSNSKMANMPSNSSSSAARNSKSVNSNHLNKKKIISPEEVIQLFSVPNAHHTHPQHPHLTGFLGHHSHSAGRQRTSSGSAIINENHRGRKSPSSASSPPTMTHQVRLQSFLKAFLSFLEALFRAFLKALFRAF